MLVKRNSPSAAARFPCAVAVFGAVVIWRTDESDASCLSQELRE